MGTSKRMNFKEGTMDNKFPEQTGGDEVGKQVRGLTLGGEKGQLFSRKRAVLFIQHPTRTW